MVRDVEELSQKIQQLKAENRRLLKERKLEARSEDAQLTSVRVAKLRVDGLVSAAADVQRLTPRSDCDPRSTRACSRSLPWRCKWLGMTVRRHVGAHGLPRRE